MKWNIHFQELLEFYDKYHTCNVPSNFCDEEGKSYISLAKWVIEQRMRHRHNKLSSYRQAKLQALVDEGRVLNIFICIVVTVDTCCVKTY
jgi:hypothetical protein